MTIIEKGGSNSKYRDYDGDVVSQDIVVNTSERIVEIEESPRSSRSRERMTRTEKGDNLRNSSGIFCSTRKSRAYDGDVESQHQSEEDDYGHSLRSQKRSRSSKSSSSAQGGHPSPA